MPLYDYDCAACGRRIEVIHGVYAPGPVHCPNCGGGPLKKAITAAAVHYRGSGWAKRDRRATVSAGSGKSSEDAAKATDGDAKATDGDPKATDSSKEPKSTAATDRDSGPKERASEASVAKSNKERASASSSPATKAD